MKPINKLSMKKNILSIVILVSLLLAGCADDPAVTRSKELLIYSPPYDLYAGDTYIFEAVLYQLNDTRTWSWRADFNGAEIASGEGEFFEVTFDQEGTYTIFLSESDREGSVDVEVLTD
jgi:hypothetical protein